MTTDSSTPPNDLPDDDWDLDDDAFSLGEAVTPEPRKANAPKEKSEPEGKVERMRTPDQPLGTVGDQTKSSEEGSGNSLTDLELDLDNEKKSARSTSVFEILSLLVLIVILVALFAWGIKSFLEETPDTKLIEFTTDFPVEGKQVTIESVETWWREPVREGDDVDVGVVIDAQLIPCARLKIGSSKSTTLQVSFRNGEDNLIGDTINLEIANGTFEGSNANVIEIHGTDGFENANDINPYMNLDLDPWSLVIVDAAYPDERLVKARVSAERK